MNRYGTTYNFPVYVLPEVAPVRGPTTPFMAGVGVMALVLFGMVVPRAARVRPGVALM